MYRVVVDLHATEELVVLDVALGQGRRRDLDPGTGGQLRAELVLVEIGLVADQDIGLDGVVIDQPRADAVGLVRGRDLFLVVEADVVAEGLQQGQGIAGGLRRCRRLGRLLCLGRLLAGGGQRKQCLQGILGGLRSRGSRVLGLGQFPDVGGALIGLGHYRGVAARLQPQGLEQGGVADAHVGTALAARLDADLGRRRALEADRHADGDCIAVGFHLAEELVLLLVAGRDLGLAQFDAVGFGVEGELLAVHVIARRNAVFGDQAVAVHAPAEAEGLLRRQQFVLGVVLKARLLGLAGQGQEGKGEPQQQRQGAFHRVHAGVPVVIQFK